MRVSESGVEVDAHATWPDLQKSQCILLYEKVRNFSEVCRSMREGIQID